TPGPGAVETLRTEEAPRPQREEAERAIGLLGDHAADRELGVADADPIAHRETEPREKGRMDERSSVSDQGVERPVRIGDEASVERIARLHRLQLDELGVWPVTVARLGHRRELTDLHHGDVVAGEACD